MNKVSNDIYFRLPSVTDYILEFFHPTGQAINQAEKYCLVHKCLFQSLYLRSHLINYNETNDKLFVII